MNRKNVVFIDKDTCLRILESKKKMKQENKKDTISRKNKTLDGRIREKNDLPEKNAGVGRSKLKKEKSKKTKNLKNNKKYERTVKPKKYPQAFVK